MHVKQRIVAIVIVGLGSACSGGSGGAPPAAPTPEATAVVFITAPPASLAVNAAATVSAAATFPIAAQGGNTAVTWTVTCGSPGACGSFGASDDAGAVTYTAPPAIPSGKSVRIAATSVANPSLSVSSSVTIVAPIPISVSFSAPASIQIGAAVPLIATVLNDVSANPEVAWTVTCGSSACGSFQPETTSSQSSTTYTAPAAIPAGGSVTLTATSVTDKTKSASARILVTAAAPTLANGTYVFQIAGSPGGQAYFITGVFVAQDGQITAGEQDSISYATDADGNPYGNSIFQTITGGNYTTTADGNVQVSIAIGPDSVETLFGTLGAGTHGFVAGINGATLSASLDLQSSTAAPSGGYAISLFGGDGSQAPAWLAGVINIDGHESISGAGSILDLIDSNSDRGPYTLSAGSVSAPDALGRVLIQLQPHIASAQMEPALLPITLAGYLVDGTRIRLVGSGTSDDATDFQGVLGGLALAQGAQTGQFSAGAVAGSSYVFGAQGDDARGPLQIAGVLTLGASGSASGSLNWNDLTREAVQSPQAFTGTYTVDPSGRVTLTQLTGGPSFSYSMHFYLAVGGNALLLSNDANDIFVGQAFLQQSTALSASSFNGVYGLNLTEFSAPSALSGQQESPAIGTITATAGGGADSVSGFADAATGGPDYAISGSVVVGTSGILGATLTGLDPGSPATPASFALYGVNDSQALIIETDSTALALGMLQGP